MIQIYNGSIGKVSFITTSQLNKQEAIDYARRKLKESYKNCTIGKVYVNDELVFENITVNF